MDDTEAGQIAADLWDALHPDNPCVARDWPTGPDPECGGLEPARFPEFSEHYPLPWPVYGRFPGDPFEPHVQDWAEFGGEGIELSFGRLGVVPDYAEDAEAMLALIDALKERHLYLLRLCNGVSNWAAWIGRSAIASSAQAVADTAPEAVARAALQALADTDAAD